jgi:hypothetical protein
VQNPRIPRGNHNDINEASANIDFLADDPSHAKGLQFKIDRLR